MEIPTVHELVTDERFSAIIDALSPLKFLTDLTVRMEDLVGQMENIELMAKRAVACPQPDPREVVPGKRDKVFFMPQILEEVALPLAATAVHREPHYPVPVRFGTHDGHGDELG